MLVTKKSKSLKSKVGSPDLPSKATHFRPQINSRHPTHDGLRGVLPRHTFKSVIRLGSTTDHPDSVTNGGRRIEINTTQAVTTSSNKRLMKIAFTNGNVRTANWTNDINQVGTGNFEFPIVAKANFGSRGNGNTLINNQRELTAWRQGKTVAEYIFEKYHNYTREYRLHVSRNGCFYTCRKVLRNGTPQDEKWHRHDDNCNWLVESNPGFDRPVNWDIIVENCVSALNSVGLDIGACDVKVSRARDNMGRNRSNPEFIVIEINSAPSFGETTFERYREELDRLLQQKHSDFISNPRNN